MGLVYNKLRYFYGFSRKTGIVFSVFGRPKQHELSLFYQNSIIQQTLYINFMSNVFKCQR
ncbi:hypothetical protein Hanom_Chr01g00039861 [Helianthus anomalus]